MSVNSLIRSAIARTLFATITACGAPPHTDEPACYLTPDKPECSCDDGNPCTEDVREFDGCKHDAVPYGESCVGEPGFCDVGGVCRTECDKAPCLDSRVEVPLGCVYDERPNGWTCVSDSGNAGLCDNGACLIPATPTEACKWHDDSAPCSYGTVNGVCNNGVCIPRTESACVAQETKCHTEDVPVGWCGTWNWPTSDRLYCRSCEEITCLGVPGCSIVGDVCQGGDGEGDCPPGCCPVCY